MSAIWLICGFVAFGCDRALVASSVLPLLKEDSNGVRIFKEPSNEIEYVLKRHSVANEESDSKERRSTMGSSFIRFGRSSTGNEANENLLEGEDSKVSRHPRWKSPDVVIRFGRSENNNKNQRNDDLYKRARGENFIRFGRNARTLPTELDVTAICTEVLSGNVVTNSRSLRAYLSRLCGYLGNRDIDETRYTYDDQLISRV